MTTIDGFGTVYEFNSRTYGIPDVFIIANNHSDYDLEHINENFIKILYPYGTEIWTEGNPENPIEIPVEYRAKHRINGWDDPEHCRSIEALIHQLGNVENDSPEYLSLHEKINKISRHNFVPRHDRLIERLSLAKRNTVILVGSQHAIKPYSFMKKEDIWENDKECVEKLHAKLASLQLWSVIIRRDSHSELKYTAKPECAVLTWLKQLIPQNRQAQTVSP